MNTIQYYLCEMQSPILEWLNHPAINRSEVAERLGVSASLFQKKLNQVQYKKFSEEEMAKLEIIRQQIIDELGNKS